MLCMMLQISHTILEKINFILLTSNKRSVIILIWITYFIVEGEFKWRLVKSLGY